MGNDDDDYYFDDDCDIDVDDGNDNNDVNVDDKGDNDDDGGEKRKSWLQSGFRFNLILFRK